MTHDAERYQPGPVFYEVFTGALRAMGRSARSWAQEIEYNHQNLRSVATGHMNGPRARELRRMMVDAVGAELFEHIYQERMRRDRANGMTGGQA